MAYYKKTNYSTPSAEDRAIDRFTELLIDRIREIDTDWQKPWLTPGTQRWPTNLDGRQYCASNALMLMLQAEKQGYTIPVWATFNRINALNDGKNADRPNVSVNKGEKSMPVFLTTFTVIHKEDCTRIPYSDYKNLPDEEKKNYLTYPSSKVFNVFNLAGQTNLKEARPELYAKLAAQVEEKRPETTEGQRFQLPVYEEMLKKQLWFCPIELTDKDSAYYSLSKDSISLPDPRFFKDGESFYGTLNHECAHSLGAVNRLNRLKGAAFGSEEYAKEELTAELSSALVSSRMGMTKNLKDDSAAYLKSWLDHMQQSPDFLKTVLTDVKKCVYHMNTRLDLIQSQIDAYQSTPGNEREYPDIYDIDNDGLFAEVIHADRPFEQTADPAPFKGRGR